MQCTKQRRSPNLFTRFPHPQRLWNPPPLRTPFFLHSLFPPLPVPLVPLGSLDIPLPSSLSASLSLVPPGSPVPPLPISLSPPRPSRLPSSSPPPSPTLHRDMYFKTLPALQRRELRGKHKHTRANKATQRSRPPAVSRLTHAQGLTR